MWDTTAQHEFNKIRKISKRLENQTLGQIQQIQESKTKQTY